MREIYQIDITGLQSRIDLGVNHSDKRLLGAHSINSRRVKKAARDERTQRRRVES